VAVQRRALQLQLFGLGLKADFDLIEHLRLRAGYPQTLEPGVAVRRDAAGAVETVRREKEQIDSTRLALKLKGKSGSIDFDGLRITWSFLVHRAQSRDVARVLLSKAGIPAGTPASTGSRASLKRSTDQGCFLEARTGTESFDADKVGSTLALRHWQPGDRFQPSGMRKSVKLQDLFGNQKVPRPLRHRLTVATTSRGELFWVEGLRISERFKLDKTTVRRLNWRWQPASG